MGVKAIRNEPLLADLTSISNFDLLLGDLPDLPVPKKAESVVSSAKIPVLDTSKASGPICEFGVPTAAIDSDADSEEFCHVITRVKTTDLSSVVGYLTAAGPVYVDRPNLDHYQRITPYHVMGNNNWRLVNSKIECVPKAFNTVPGYKRKSPWDSFGSGEKKLCMELVSKMRKEATRSAKEQIRSFNLKVSRKISADSLKKAMASAPQKQRPQAEKLVVGPVVAWQQPPLPGCQEMGEFKAVVKGFTGDHPHAVLPITAEPDIYSPASEVNVPAGRPLIKLEPTCLAQVRQDQEDAFYHVSITK